MNRRTIKTTYGRRLTRMLLPAILLTLAGCATTSGTSWSSWGTDLDTWIDKDLEPYVEKQLKTHPRFKGEPVVIVAATDESGKTNGLADNIRARLTDKLVQIPGVVVVMPDDEPSPGAGLACDPSDRAHYRIEVETGSAGGGALKVIVRAYDLEDRAWVSGFARQWEGGISARERSLLRKKVVDEDRRGGRELPFDLNQTDLMASLLARRLGCELRGYDYSELLVFADRQGVDNPDLAAAPELVGNNLVQFRAATLTDDPDKANLVLRGKAHPVERDLYQYWVMVRPVTESEELPAVDTSVYVVVRDRLPVVAHVPDRPGTAKPVSTSLMSRLRVIRPVNQHYCSGRDPWRHGVRRSNVRFGVSDDECFGLEIELYRDAHLFVLNHRRDGSLTRIEPESCSDSGRHRTPVYRGRIRFPGEARAFDGADEAGLETFYAIAVADRNTAARVRDHMRRIPAACGNSGGSGLYGAALDDWLEGLDEIIRGPEPGVDWKAVRVRHRS